MIGGGGIMRTRAPSCPPPLFRGELGRRGGAAGVTPSFHSTLQIAGQTTHTPSMLLPGSGSAN